MNAIESSKTLTEITSGLDGGEYPHSCGTHTKNMTITVLLADDHEIVRKAIRRVLESESQIEIVGEAEDFAQTIKMTTDLKPQIVVMDLHMPDGDCVRSSDVKASLALSASRLLAISIWDDKDSKALAVTYGAIALLDKAKLGADLIPTIKHLLSDA